MIKPIISVGLKWCVQSMMVVFPTIGGILLGYTETISCRCYVPRRSLYCSISSRRHALDRSYVYIRQHKCKMLSGQNLANLLPPVALRAGLKMRTNKNPTMNPEERIRHVLGRLLIDVPINLKLCVIKCGNNGVHVCTIWLDHYASSFTRDYVKRQIYSIDATCVVFFYLHSVAHWEVAEALLDEG